MMRGLLAWLFYQVPETVWEVEERSAYESALARLRDGALFSYDLPYPKARFLHYLAQQGEWLFHGSNQPDIAVFEPREQTLFDGTMTKAVFASSEPLWSMFYAVLDRSKVVGGFRNACLVHGKRKFLFYSLNESTMNQQPWTNGMMYVLPRSSFRLADTNKTHFDEWISHEPVVPVAKWPLSPDEFPFRDRVAVHPDGESLLKSWMKYKSRCQTVTKMNKGATVKE